MYSLPGGVLKFLLGFFSRKILPFRGCFDTQTPPWHAPDPSIPSNTSHIKKTLTSQKAL